MLKKLVIVGSLLAVGPLLAGCMTNSFGSYNWRAVSFSDQQLCNYVANYNDQASSMSYVPEVKAATKTPILDRRLGTVFLRRKRGLIRCSVILPNHSMIESR